MQCVAIDVGTSFTKAALVNVATGQISQIRRTASIEANATSDELRVEIDADKIVQQVRSLIDGLLDPSTDCKAILLSGQMGGLVLTDQSGQAVLPYLSWLDKRLTAVRPGHSESWFECLAKIVGDRSETQLGNEFRPGLTLPLLYWLHQHDPAVVDAGHLPCTLPDYVAARLCDTIPVMERTCACGLLHVSAGNFAEDIFEDLNLHSLRWPQLVDFRHQVGQMKQQTGKPAIPVYAAVGDHQCALLGTGLQNGELSINVATGSQISTVTVDAASGPFQLRSYFDGQLLKTITNIPAGRSLSGLVRLLSETHQAIGNSADDTAAWDYFFQQAEAVTDADMEANLAFFPAVIEGPGNLSNLHEGNLTVGHVAHSSLKAMAGYYDQLANRLDEQRPWSRGVLSGGVVQKSRLLQRLIAERLQVPFRLASSTEDTLTGLTVLGRVICGLSTTVQEAHAALIGDEC